MLGHKLVAHSQVGARRLGRLLAQHDRSQNAKATAWRYLDEFTQVMRRIPTRRSHTKMLQHLAGYGSDNLDRDEREELSQLVDQYRHALLPLIVPMTMLRHYVRKVQCPICEIRFTSRRIHKILMLLNQ